MNYVTFLNYFYLPQLLVLLESMRRYKVHDKLYVVALDDKTYNIVRYLGHDIVAINVSILENRALLQAKQNRTAVEYIWTLTPFCISHILEEYDHAVTYIDCDTQFQKYPVNIKKLHEINIDKVILTPHFFENTKRNLESKHGKYCVQFLCFKKSQHELLLQYWKNSVLERCSAVPIDGYFGDQKYIENFKSILSDKVIENIDKDLFGGPWNMNSINAARLEVFHFHGTRYIGEKKFKLFDWSYQILETSITEIYFQFITDIYEKILDLEKNGFKQSDFMAAHPAKERLKSLISRNIGEVN